MVLFKGLEASDDQAPDMAHAHRELDGSHPGEPVSAFLQGHDGDTNRVLVLGHLLESQDAANGILGVLVGRLDEVCQGGLGVWVFVEAGIQLVVVFVGGELGGRCPRVQASFRWCLDF